MGVRRVCVFCGSRLGAKASYLAQAKILGRTLAQRNIGLVYGGASVGLMGALADEALSHGGEVVGVIPRTLVDREVAHRSLTTLHVVEGMHARKAKMNELSQAFIAMPGGLGTLEELFEVASWAMLGLHAKPIVLLGADDYWAPLEAMLRRAVDEGFLDPKHAAFFVRAAAPEEALDAIGAKESSTGQRVPPS